MNRFLLLLSSAVVVGLSACSSMRTEPIQVKVQTELKTEGERISPPSVVMRAGEEAEVAIGDGVPRTSDFRGFYKTTKVGNEYFLSGYVQRGQLKRLTGPGRFAKGVFTKIPVDGKMHKVPMGTLGYAEIVPTWVDASGSPIVR